MKRTMYLFGMLLIAQSVICLPLDPPSTEIPTTTTTLAPETNSSTSTSAPINSTTTDHPLDAEKHPANCTHLSPATFNAPVSLTIDLIELVPADPNEPLPIQTRAAGKGTDDLIASLSSSIQAKLAGGAATKPAKVEETPAPAAPITPAEGSKTAAPAPIPSADSSKTAAPIQPVESSKTAAPIATASALPADASKTAAPIATADTAAAPAETSKTAATAPIAPADSAAAAAPIALIDSKLASENKTAEISTTPALNKTEEAPKLITRAAEEESKTETLVGKIKQWVEDKLSLSKPEEPAKPTANNSIASNSSASDATPAPSSSDTGNKTLETLKNDTKVTRDAEKSPLTLPVLEDAPKNLSEAAAGSNADAKLIPSSISKVTTEAEKSVVTSNSTESIADPSAPAAPAAAPTQTEKIIGKVVEGALIDKPGKTKAHISKRSYGSSASSAPSDVPASAPKYSYAVRHAPAPAAPAPAARSNSGYPAPATSSGSGYAAPAPAPTTSAPDSAPTTAAPTPTPTTAAPAAISNSGYPAPAPAAISSAGYPAPAPATISNSGYAAPAPAAAGRFRRGTWGSSASDSAIPKENPGKAKDLPTVLSAPSKVRNTWA